MNIGQASRASGLPAKTIRYYEDIGLVAPARRGNGYRAYSGAHLHNLQFLARARSLGFSIEDCRKLLSLYEDSHRASSDVKKLAGLVAACHGDDLPDCPILDDLAGETDE
jgi:DNA-binding transcriptional MerR regulator